MFARGPPPSSEAPTQRVSPVGYIVSRDMFSTLQKLSKVLPGFLRVWLTACTVQVYRELHEDEAALPEKTKTIRLVRLAGHLAVEVLKGPRCGRLLREGRGGLAWGAESSAREKACCWPKD